MFRGYTGNKTKSHKKGETGEKLSFLVDIIKRDFPDVPWDFPGWFNSNGDITLEYPDKKRFIEIKCKEPHYKFDQALTFEDNHYRKCTECEALYFISTYPEKALIFNIRPKILMPDLFTYDRWCKKEKRQVNMYGMIPFEDCRAKELVLRPGIELEKCIVDKKIVGMLNEHNSSIYDTKTLYKRYG